MTEKVTYSADQIELYLELYLLILSMDTRSLAFAFLEPQRETMRNEIHQGIASIYNIDAQPGSLAWIDFIANLPGIKKPSGLQDHLEKFLTQPK